MEKIFKNKINFTALLLLVFIVFYFSWLPDPYLKSEKYLPSFILNWCNKYYNLRTAIPFTCIGFILELMGFDRKTNRDSRLKKILRHTVYSFFLVVIAEVGQLFILLRNPDLRDVFFGISGSITGSFLFYLVLFLYKKKVKMIMPKSKNKPWQSFII